MAVDYTYESVRVHNLGPRTINDSYNSRRYTIQPGQEAIVPKEAAFIWFGEGPFFVRDPITNRDRAAEYLRVRGRYGAMPGAPGANDWEEVRPRVRVFEGDGLTEWVLVIDDPTTDNLPADVRDAPTTATAAVRDILRDPDAVRILRERLFSDAGETQNDVPTDTPEPGHRRGRPPKAKIVVPAEVESQLEQDTGLAWGNAQTV